MGKTALTQMFQSKGKLFPKNYKLTGGMDVVVAPVPVEGTKATVELYVCDVSGHEMFSDMLPQLLENVNMVILVYDQSSRKSFDACAASLKLLNSVPSNRGQTIKGVLVGNKHDLVGQVNYDADGDGEVTAEEVAAANEKLGKLRQREVSVDEAQTVIGTQLRGDLGEVAVQIERVVDRAVGLGLRKPDVPVAREWEATEYNLTGEDPTDVLAGLQAGVWHPVCVPCWRPHSVLESSGFLQPPQLVNVVGSDRTSIHLLQRDNVSVPALYLLGDCIEISVDLGLALPASASQRGTTAVVNVPGDDGEGVTGPELRGVSGFTRDDLAPGGDPSTGEPNEGCQQSRESRSHDYPPPPTHEVHFPLRHRSDKSQGVTWTTVGSGLSAAP